MAVSLASLLVKASKSAIYETALAVAARVGLPVTTWQAGDPTRSLYHLEAELLSTLEDVVAGFISSGFLDYATGTWLEILAAQVFGVTVPEATYASTDVVLTNGGGGVYDFDAGDLTLKNTTTGATYRNTTGGHLAAGGTLTVTVEAEEAGSGSSAGAGEINDFVGGPLGVTCSNATAAVGVDKQDEATTRQQCRDKLGSLSPNGPREAYSYVARNSGLTGTTGVTDARVYASSTTGDVTVYLRGPSGGVSAPDRAAVEDAIVTWATPLCITPTVLSATPVTIAVTYELWIYRSCNKTSAEIQAAVSAALESLFAARPIGGDIVSPATTGQFYKSLIESTIRGVYSQAFRVSVSSPSADTALGNGDVAVLGAVTGTIHLETDP